MIISLFGPPCPLKSFVVDDLKGVFMNVDEGRMRKAFKGRDHEIRGSDIAAFLDNSGLDVVLSLDYKSRLGRGYLNNFGLEVYWVYFEGEVMPNDFEPPKEDEKVLTIKPKTSPAKCLEMIEAYINYP